MKFKKKKKKFQNSFVKFYQMKRKLEETLNGKEELTVTSSSISNSRDQKQESTIPGMFYIDDFISKENESELIKTIDQNNWSNELSRRVQVCFFFFLLCAFKS